MYVRNNFLCSLSKIRKIKHEIITSISYKEDSHIQLHPNARTPKKNARFKGKNYFSLIHHVVFSQTSPLRSMYHFQYYFSTLLWTLFVRGVTVKLKERNFHFFRGTKAKKKLEREGKEIEPSSRDWKFVCSNHCPKMNRFSVYSYPRSIQTEEKTANCWKRWWSWIQVLSRYMRLKTGARDELAWHSSSRSSAHSKLFSGFD